MLDPQMLLRCEKVFKLLYYLVKFGGAQTLPATGAAKDVEFLSACLYDRVCAYWYYFAMKSLENSHTTIIWHFGFCMGQPG